MVEINHSKMAKDVAREIWKLAVEDTSYHNMELKDIYMKKLRHEKRALLIAVKECVAKYIQTSHQSFSSVLNLNGNMAILGYLAQFRKYRIDDTLHPYSEGNIFMMKIDETFYIEIINEQSKFLIEHALIPLDLRWKINEYDKNFQLSWDHWKKSSEINKSNK